MNIMLFGNGTQSTWKTLDVLRQWEMETLLGVLFVPLTRWIPAWLQPHSAHLHFLQQTKFAISKICEAKGINVCFIILCLFLNKKEQ